MADLAGEFYVSLPYGNGNLSGAHWQRFWRDRWKSC